MDVYAISYRLSVTRAFSTAQCSADLLASVFRKGSEAPVFYAICTTPSMTGAGSIVTEVQKGVSSGDVVSVIDLPSERADIPNFSLSTSSFARVLSWLRILGCLLLNVDGQSSPWL
jgi:hypothetical protein